MLREGFRCDLKVILAQTGVKANKLCEITGLKDSAISNIVNGKSDPPTTTAEIIASYLNKTVEEIWVDEHKENRLHFK